MKAAIVGCGAAGEMHARTATLCGLDVVACGDVNAKRARRLARSFKAEASTDCASVIRRDDVDIVVVASPTPSHADLIVGAAKAGKHIFCEAPLSRTALEGRRALRAAKRAGVKLFAGHSLRYDHAFAAIEDQVKAGKVGEVGFIRSLRAGACPSGEGDWYHDFAMSGGVVLDQLIHDFDWIQSVFGRPKRVFCQNLLRSHPHAMDYAMATLTLESGVIAQVVGSWAHPLGDRIQLEVCGQGGMIQYDSEAAPLRAMKRSGANSKSVFTSNPVGKPAHQLAWEDFLAWIDGKGAPRVSPEDALAAVRIAEGALKSAASGKPVTFR